MVLLAFLLTVLFGWVLGLITAASVVAWIHRRRKKRIQRVIQEMSPERREAALARLHVRIEQSHERIEHELSQL